MKNEKLNNPRSKRIHHPKSFNQTDKISIQVVIRNMVISLSKLDWGQIRSLWVDNKVDNQIDNNGQSVENVERNILASAELEPHVVTNEGHFIKDCPLLRND